MAGVSESNSGLPSHSCHVHILPPQTFPSNILQRQVQGSGNRGHTPSKETPTSQLTHRRHSQPFTHPHPHSDALRTRLLCLPSSSPTRAAQPLPLRILLQAGIPPRVQIQPRGAKARPQGLRSWIRRRPSTRTRRWRVRSGLEEVWS